jgi:hypothetical protein
MPFDRNPDDTPNKIPLRIDDPDALLEDRD